MPRQPLLVLPLVALLYGPLVGRSPEIFGTAFFYWYEFACVVLSAATAWFVYRPERAPVRPADEEPRFSRDAAIRQQPARTVTRR